MANISGTDQAIDKRKTFPCLMDQCGDGVTRTSHRAALVAMVTEFEQIRHKISCCNSACIRDISRILAANNNVFLRSSNWHHFVSRTVPRWHFCHCDYTWFHLFCRNFTHNRWKLKKNYISRPQLKREVSKTLGLLLKNIFWKTNKNLPIHAGQS